MTNKIYSSFFLSILFHFLIFISLIFGIKSSTDLKNPIYVTLIEDSGIFAQPSQQKINETLQNTPKTVSKKEESLSRNSIERSKENDEKLLKERIAALEAKKKILQQAQSQGTTAIKNVQGEAVSPTYLSMISNLIRKNWSIPDTVPTNLEAVVLIRILPNGEAIIEGFEKKSGNALFDSSVIRAIKTSTPLPPPRGEITVGLRFKP